MATIALDRRLMRSRARVFAKRNVTLVAGAVVLLLLALSAVAAPRLTSTDPQRMSPSDSGRRPPNARSGPITSAVTSTRARSTAAGSRCGSASSWRCSLCLLGLSLD
jgi:hypothetical protein